MVRKDYTKYLIPRKLKNDSKYASECDTVDKVWIPSLKEYIQAYRKRMGISMNTESVQTIKKNLHKLICTDFVVLACIMNAIPDKENKEVNYAGVILRSNTFESSYAVDNISGYNGDLDSTSVRASCPSCVSVNLQIDSNEDYDIYENESKEHILRIGEYLNHKVDKDKSEQLEKMYNGGALLDGFTCTGRWYSLHAEGVEGNILRHSPEFEYEGERYARVVSYEDTVDVEEDKYLSDGSKLLRRTTINWVKVEPIEMVVSNWEEISNRINPDGSGRDNFFDLTSDKAIYCGTCFYPSKEDEGPIKTLWQNASLRGSLNGINVMNITENGNPKYALPDGGDYSDGCSFIEEAFHLDREPMVEYSIPKWQKQIPDDCFNGCISLKKLIIHSNVNKIGRRAFEGLKFRYFYKDENGNGVFSEDLPKDIEVLDLNDVNNAFSGFDYGLLITGDDEERENIFKLAKFCSKRNINIPYPYALALVKENKTNCITENTNFKFFRKEFKDINNRLLEFPEEERIYFYSFAYALGCFSDKKVLDDSGKETDVYVAQKACSALVRIMKMSERTKLGKFQELLERHEYDKYGYKRDVQDTLPLVLEVNQDFLSLALEQNGQNLKVLLDLESKYYGIFLTVFKNFDMVRLKKKVIDENEHVKYDSWENAFKRTYAQNIFENVEPGTEDIAELLGEFGLSQEMFEKVCELRSVGETEKMPHHLLGTELKEGVIETEIDRIRKEGADNLGECVGLLDELYRKKFSYEWLDKYSPINGVIGMYTDCCAIAINKWNGPDVVRATMTKHDVQNLILRDSNGKIMGKIAAYINKEYGYIVLNEPFVNKGYLDGNGKRDENMKLISEAFARGIQDFIHEYDERNPDNPIRQVNLAKKYFEINPKINVFEEAEKRLEVPEEYGFREAMLNKEQHVIYRRNPKMKDRESSIEIEEK